MMIYKNQENLNSQKYYVNKKEMRNPFLQYVKSQQDCKLANQKVTKDKSFEELKPLPHSAKRHVLIPSIYEHSQGL